MSLAEEIEASWALLRPAIQPGAVETRRIPGEAWHEAMLALDDQERRHLLIPVSEDAPLQEDRAASGVQVVEHRLIQHGQTKRFVDLFCRKPHLDELFTTIVVEVLERLVAGTPPDAAAIQTLDRWRELLSSESSRIPPTSQLLGAFGELLCLRELISRNHTSTDAWVGPSGARHDLLTAHGAMEVKTTLTRAGWSVEIHGLDQLDSPALGPLLLVVLRIEQHPTEGSSLPALVDEIVHLGGNRKSILEGLARLGMTPDVMNQIAPLHFAERERRLYLVGSEFPRLSTDMLRTGTVPAEIVNVNYRLDLNAVSHLPEVDAARLLSEIAG